MCLDGREPEQKTLDAEVASHGKEKGKDLPSMEELRAEELNLLQDQPVEKKDIFAMILSAFVTIFPICVVLICALCLLTWVFFFR